MAEGSAVYLEMIPLIGSDPASPEVQVLVARWHQNLRHFYEPTPEILRGLGQHYNQDARFTATFDKFDPGLAPFFEQAINVYVDALERSE